jgi:hypothetical protein
MNEKKKLERFENKLFLTIMTMKRDDFICGSAKQNKIFIILTRRGPTTSLTIMGDLLAVKA